MTAHPTTRVLSAVALLCLLATSAAADVLHLQSDNEIDADRQLVQYAQTYADKLLALQDPDGCFPGWLHPDTLEPAGVMAQTPETAMSVTFLLKLAELTGDRIVLTDLAKRVRPVKVSYADGQSRIVRLNGSTTLPLQPQAPDGK